MAEICVQSQQLAVSLVQVLGSLRHVRPTNPKTRSVLAPSKSSAIDGVETYARSLSPDVWRGLSEHRFGRGIISLKDVGDNAGEVLGKGFEVHERARRDVISSSCLDGPARPESILSLGQRRLQSRNKKAPFSRRRLHTFPALRSQETKPPSSPQSGPTTNEPRQPGMTYADPSLLNSSSPSFPNFLQTSGEQTQPEPKRYVQGTGLTEEQLVNAVLSKKAGKDATVRIVGDQSGASSPAESSAHPHPGPGQPNPSPQMQQPGFSPSESQSAVRQLGLHPSTNLNQSATTFSAPLSWSSMMDRLKGVFGQGDRLRAAANSTEHYPDQQQPQPGFAHPQQQQQPSSNYQQWPQGHPQQFSSQNPYPAAMGPAGIASPGGQAGGFPPPPPPPSGNGASNGTSQPGHGSQPFASTAPPEPIRVVIEEARGNLVFRALRFVGITVIYSFLILTLVSLVLDGSGVLRATASPSPAEFQPASGKKVVKFSDVHGCDEAKDELQEVVEFLKDPTRFGKLGGRLPRGVLLTGPPGTGKTLLARAVAGEAGVRFFFASGSEFDEMYVGVGARRIRELFAAARKAAPAIVFIDELDAIGSKRSPRDQHYVKQTLNQLLVELDGFSQTEGVILIGATNFPESLDKALTRPGRFDRHIVVPLPDVRGRLQILHHHMKNVHFHKDVDVSGIARGTPGFSGAELQNLVNQAAVKASREGSTTITTDHFEWAKDKITMGAERRSAVITPENRRKTAIHEGGHALVALYTSGAMPLHKVTCMPRGSALGVTYQLPEMDKVSESFLEFRARLDVAFGGRVAEELIYGKDNITSGASSDIANATHVANLMVRRYGFGSENLGPVLYDEDEKLSPHTKAMVEDEIKGLIEGAQARATAILKSHRIELERLANALVEYETLTHADVLKVISGHKLDKETV